MNIATELRFFPFQPIITLAMITFLFSTQSHATLLVDLDATVSESVSGNPVTQWADQSGNEFHATTTLGTIRYPTSNLSASGLVGVDFSGGVSRMKIMNPEASKRLLDFTDGTGGLAIVVAFKDQMNRDDHTDFSNIIANSDRIFGGFFIRYHEGRNDLEFSLAGSQKMGLIADGDTVVVGLNYDADTGAYTATMMTSSGEEKTITGIIPPKDFSTSHDLSLGSVNFQKRHFEGIIGKVIIYENELPETDFDNQMQRLKQIWIAPTVKTFGLLLF